MASTYLTRTQSSTGSETKGTFSAWVKRAGITTSSNMYTSYQANNEFCDIQFNSSDQLQVVVKIGGTDYLDLRTTRLFRDTSAFYHVLVAFDSTDVTQADRCKIYVNGTRETSFATNTNNVSSSLNMRINGSSQDPYIGSWHNQGNYFSGVMSHVHWVDGTAYAPTVFGETDATTGEWKIKTNVTATYGTNGFFILKDGNSVTDQSGNSNNFTVGGGTLTNTEDNPSNVFNVWNRNFLTRHHNESTSIPGMLQNGNTTFNSTANDFYGYKAGTLGVTSGKWYWEGKIIDNGRMYIGICYPTVVAGINTPFYDSSIYSAVTLDNGGSIQGITGDAAASGVSFANNDIIGFALDMDNKGLYVHKNGTYVLSGNPASGSSLTGSVIESLSGTKEQYLGSGDFVSPFVGDPSTTGTHHSQFNFGNGFFGTTAISSEGTNASGIGKFEYDVPTGYTALSTKGLNL